MMYSAYKLNKQDDNIQPWCTPFPIWNQSVVPCPVLTVASWPAYRFLKRQVRWSGIPISWRIFMFIYTPSYLTVNLEMQNNYISCFRWENFIKPLDLKFNSVQLLSHVQLFVTPWTAAHLSITNSQSLLKLMLIESVKPSNHFILCHPLLLPPSIFPSIRVFSNESVLRIRWPK